MRDPNPIPNRCARWSWSLSLLLALGALHSATAEPRQAPGCDCDRAAVLERLRTAPRIVYGTLVEASMETPDSETIALTIKPIEWIRGTGEPLVKMKTTLPNDCGLPTAVSAWDNYYLVPDSDAPITRCNGSAGASGIAHHWNILPALILLEHEPGDFDTLDRWLERARVGLSDEDRGRRLFELLDELDVDYDVEFSESAVRYRRLIFEYDAEALRGYRYRWVDDE